MNTIPTRKRALIIDRLLKWFRHNRRAFPWRDTFEHPDPYTILFTEIMLQRTRASQVVPVYQEFFGRYPTLEKLAQGSRDEVLDLLYRLGLKWRARIIPSLISILRVKYYGKVPEDPDELRALPGVGEYVARAVECYAFGRKVIPIDTNVVRVVSRVFGLTVKPDEGRRNRTVEELAKLLAPERGIRDFNLALLDFAAMICKPKPLCPVCPLKTECTYFAHSRKVEMKGS